MKRTRPICLFVSLYWNSSTQMICLTLKTSVQFFCKCSLQYLCMPRNYSVSFPRCSKTNNRHVKPYIHSIFLCFLNWNFKFCSRLTDLGIHNHSKVLDTLSGNLVFSKSHQQKFPLTQNAIIMKLFFKSSEVFMKYVNNKPYVWIIFKITLKQNIFEVLILGFVRSLNQSISNNQPAFVPNLPERILPL